MNSQQQYLKMSISVYSPHTPPHPQLLGPEFKVRE